MQVLTLIETMATAGLSEAMQDAVVEAARGAPSVLVDDLNGLLTGAGVGAAAALRVSLRLVSVNLKG